MKTKQDFLEAALANLDDYPKVAMLYRAGDPRVTQHLGAIASMLAMLSQQTEVAVMEVFNKTRPATILADAAMRGIIPRAEGVRVQLKIHNPSIQALSLQAGRTVVDSGGNPYTLETPVTVEARGDKYVVARQGFVRTISHRVTNAEPFYAIEVPASDDDSHLSTIEVSDGQGALAWSNHYNNVMAGDRVYHVEVDDRQRVYVRFGFDGVVGIQPAEGAEITLSIGYARGDMAPEAGSPFALEYVNDPLEAGAKITAYAVVQKGQDPIDIDVLRNLARFPSVYQDSAVFLGEFEFLVRKRFPTLQFASVWNEAAEEAVRGVSLDNINTLFVACLSDAGTERVLSQAHGTSTPAQVIPDAELTDTQKAIKQVILTADDSYKVRFYTAVRSEIPMIVNARVASSYRAQDVKAQIIDVLLKAYGSSSPAARRGHFRPLYQQVYELLRTNVPALMGGDSDWTLNIAEPSGAARPELWRYVSAQSLTVNVDTMNVVQPSWGFNA